MHTLAAADHILYRIAGEESFLIVEEAAYLVEVECEVAAFPVVGIDCPVENAAHSHIDQVALEMYLVFVDTDIDSYSYSGS